MGSGWGGVLGGSGVVLMGWVGRWWLGLGLWWWH